MHCKTCGKPMKTGELLVDRECILCIAMDRDRLRDVRPDARLQEACEAARELQEWFHAKLGYDVDEFPYVTVSWTVYTLAVEVDDLTLWCSKDDPDAPLTFEGLRDAFTKHIESLFVYLATDEE